MTNLDKYPLLSICIPTYNRADVLRVCLDSIISSDIFAQGDIEVIIGDNCSMDETWDVISKYSSKYSMISGYRNKMNIGAERNFLRILSTARGKFKKLHNDYSVFTSNGLEYLYEAVKKKETSREPIFFENNIGECLTIIDNLSMSDIVEKEAWRMSWLGNYGYWAEDYDALSNKDGKINTLFLQTDFFLRILEKYQKGSVACASYTTRYSFRQKQGGYNFFKVHTRNFLSLFEPYYKSGKITTETYDVLHYKLFTSLLPFLTKFLITEKENYTYELNGWLVYFIKAFGRYPWFYKKMAKWFWKNSKYLLKQ